MKKVELKKVGEVPGARLPEQIRVGFKIKGEIEDWRKPTVGQRFWVGKFDTCGVEEIIDENTFRTYGSIFKLRFINSRNRKT